MKKQIVIGTLLFLGLASGLAVMVHSQKSEARENTESIFDSSKTRDNISAPRDLETSGTHSFKPRQVESQFDRQPRETDSGSTVNLKPR